MALTTEAILATEPRLIQTTYGRWLAVSQPGSQLRIGVIGETEEDARQRFVDEREAWRALHEQEDQPTPEADQWVASQERCKRLGAQAPE